MPHKQKENHDHSAKSKRERLRAKEEQLAKKKAALEARLKAEAEAAALKPNNITLVEGAGAYEIGCEAEQEIPIRFNINKRSKKHLRQDVRRNAERKEREEQERLQREQEERFLQEQKEKEEQQRLEEGGSPEEEEEEEEGEEYLVYICECCGKKYATTNQFANHANSRKHRANAALYEEAGIIVTSVQLKLRLDDDDQYQEYKDNQFDEFEYGDGDSDDSDIDEEYLEEEYNDENENDGDEGEESSQEDEVEEPPEQKKVNLFSALMDDSSSESSDEDESDNEEYENTTPPQPPQAVAPVVDKEEEPDDDDDEEDEELLEEMIQQNRILLNELDAEKANAPATVEPTPLPFDDDQYNPELYTAEQNRLLSVHHRLQKRLAAKGIESTRTLGGSYYGASDAVSIGKTLLQQLMEANKDTLAAKLEAYNKHKAECQLLNKEFALSRGNSKALAGQYVYKPGAADNARTRANVHHAGSHYHMQMARSMQFGREKGMMARHSSQGARLQAKRMAAKEMARVQQGGGGMKIGKTSGKSKMKRQGEAGGSKKTGGMASES